MQTAKKYEESAFGLIMDQILVEMEKNAEAFKDDKEELSPYQHVKEFRTIHLGYGRRNGKTRYIQEREDFGDLILIPAGRFRILHPNPKADVLTSGDIMQLSKEDINALTKKTIWIEEPALHENLDKAIEKLISSYDQTVIMVGA